MTPRGRELLDYFTSQLGTAIELLREMVSIDSPTSDKAAVDRMGGFVAERFREAGARVTIHRQAEAGDLVSAAFGPEGERPAILLGHLDTVWPVGEAARRPFRAEGGFGWGPGVFDMKVGILVCLLLARAAREGAVRPCLPVVCLLSGDEETGSPVSRPRLEETARGARYVLGLEPPMPDGGAKTARKGVGRVILEVAGAAAHAGIDPGKGVNAIEELAAQILAIKLLESLAPGITIHAGLVGGGVAKNVVAPSARAEFDVRVVSPADWARLEAALLSLRPRHPKARLTVRAELTHPPMVRTGAIASLYAKGRRAAAQVGFDLTEGATGGGSDGSHCAALGVPVLDGLGLEGDGAHALGERVRIERLAPRAAFLGCFLESVEGP